MYKFSEKINEAIQQCVDNGSCSGINLMDEEKTCIMAEWVSIVAKQNYDIVEIYISQSGYIKFSFKIEETKIFTEE